MAYETNETIKRLWQRFVREQLTQLPPDQRKAFQEELERRFSQLQRDSANGEAYGFADLIGFGEKGVVPFSELPFPYIAPDFDEAVIPSQLHAAAELYYVYQHERMRIFEVVDVLRRLFQTGRMRIQRGPGARGLYLLEK